MRKIILFMAVLIMMPLPSYALSASADGRCRDFVVSVWHEAEGCFDVKIDAPAQVLHKDGWKDSFFYVQNALCSGKAVLRLRMSTTENATATVKLRQGSSIEQAQLEIIQDCEVAPQDVFFPVVFVVIAVMLALVWWEMRR